MSISNENNRVDLVAAAGQTIFSYDFKINASDEIAVYLTPVSTTPDDAANILILTTDYSVSGVGADAGGTITLTSAATLDDAIVMVRAIDFDQPNEFVIGQDHAENIEDALDDMSMRIQRLSEAVSRALRTSVASGNTDPLPDPDPGKILGWSATNEIENTNKASASGVASNAEDVIVSDAGGYFTGSDAELVLQEIGLLKAESVEDKAAALLITPEDGRILVINSADGRGNTWIGVVGSPAGTWADDGGLFCGTVIIPPGGNGSIAFVRAYNGPKHSTWYGGIGDDSTDETATIQKFLDAAGDLWLDQGDHQVNHLTLSSATMLRGTDLSFLRRIAVTGTTVLLADGKNNIIVEGISISGNKLTETNISHHCLHFNGGYNLQAINVSAFSSKGSGIRIEDVDGTTTTNKYQSVISRCEAWGCNGDGLRIEGKTRKLLVDGGAYRSNTGNGILANGTLPFDLMDIRITNNSTTDNTLRGIAVDETATDCYISNNLVKDNDDDGIMYLGRYGVISDNVCTGNGVTGDFHSGILTNGATEITIIGNVCNENALDGIDVGAVERGTISGNICDANDGAGIEINGATQTICTGNECRNNNVTTIAGSVASGILVWGNIQASSALLVSNNIVSSGANQLYGILVDPAANSIADGTVSSNYVKNSGTTSELMIKSATVRCNNNHTVIANIASSATITIQDDDPGFFNITGTTNITDIDTDGGFDVAGRKITLNFAGILTVIDGTLKLAGNFVTSVDDTLTLFNNGTTWVELSRSAN